ncbi:hypothetical protein EDC01DRAFT_481196 [Geopyxis carbonaria]|nr:hypothetical protein EDC01DRAFT_481196 [Geopyxis carbonaria]
MTSSSSPEKSPSETPSPSVIDMPASPTPLSSSAAASLSAWLHATGHTTSDTVPVSALKAAIERSMSGAPTPIKTYRCKTLAVLVALFLLINFLVSVILYCQDQGALAIYAMIIGVLTFCIPLLGAAGWCLYRSIYMKGKRVGMREYQIRLEGVDKEVREELLGGHREMEAGSSSASV